MSFKFLSIVKANARIAELETENSALSTAIASNESEVVKSAESLNSKVTELSAANEQFVKDLATARASIASEGAEVAKLKAELAAKETEVATRAAAKAVETIAQLGQPAAPSVPVTATAPAAPKLFGIARFIAAEKAESAAKNSKP